VSAEVELPGGPPPSPYREAVRRLRASSFSRHVAETFGARIAVLGLGVVSTLLVTRILGPAGRGEYAVATALTGTGVQLGNLGLHASNTYNAGRDRRLVPALYSNSLRASFGACGVGTAAALLLFLLRPELAPVRGWAMVLALAAIPFSLAYLLLRSLQLGVHEVREYNRIDVGTSVLGVALIGAVIAARSVGVESLLACALVVAAASFAWTAASLRGYVAGKAAPSMALFRTTLRYGTKAYLAALFAYLAQRVDILFLTRIAGSEQTGYYAAATSIATVATLFPIVAGTILFPRLSSMTDPAERWRLTRRVLAVVSAGMVGVCALGVLLAPVAVRLLLGVVFLPAVEPLRWLMPGVLLRSANSILMNHFAAGGMPRITVYSPAAALAVNVALNLLLIPRLGTVGAAVASFAGSAALLAASLVYLAANPARRGA